MTITLDGERDMAELLEHLAGHLRRGAVERLMAVWVHGAGRVVVAFRAGALPALPDASEAPTPPDR